MYHCFLDTNVIIRYVTQDEPTLAKKAQAILKRVKEGSLRVTTCESIVSECVYILSSKRLYHLPRPHIAAILKVILAFQGLKLTHKKTYVRALNLYASSSLDFEDTLAVAHMERQHITDIYSFDRDFDKVEGVKRRTS